MAAITGERQPDQEQLARIGRMTVEAFATCVSEWESSRADGGECAPSLDAELGIPTSAAGFAKKTRDFWLRRAMWSAPGMTSEAKYTGVVEFIERGTWRLNAWRVHGVPPDAEEFERCIFAASLACALPGAKQLRRILRGADIKPT